MSPMRPPWLRTSPIRAAATTVAAARRAAPVSAPLTLAAGPPPVAGAAAPTQNAQAEYKAAVAAVGKQGVHFASHGGAERHTPSYRPATPAPRQARRASRSAEGRRRST